MKDFLGSFAEGIAGLTRAFLFPSVVAVALWAYFVVDVASRDPNSIYADLRAINGSDTILVLAGASLAVALLLGVITPVATRWLEGYWWGRHQNKGPLHWFWNQRVKRHHKARKAVIQGINALIPANSSLSTAQKARLSRLQAQYSRYPEFPSATMPTKLGNVLRAGELFGSSRYGLDAISLWDPLLASAPESLVAAQSNRRTNLDLFVSTTVLPPLFLLATLHAVATTPVSRGQLGVIAIVGVVVCVVSYLAAVEAAKSYADSITAIVQLGRQPLAKMLGLAVPATVEGEKALWQAVSGFAFWGESVARTEGWVSTIETARGGSASVARDLLVLAQLQEQGQITPAEFATAKRHVLSETK